MKAIILAAVAAALAPARPVPVTGANRPGMKSLDEMMVSFIRTHDVPGGALAVVRNRKIVYARGFGYADPASKTPVRPDALFRIASVSKPITSAAIMQLVERNKLRLSDRVFDILPTRAHGNGKVDPRLKTVTIRHLLLHTGGWDRGKSGDPMFRPVQIARALGVTPPARAGHVMKYMLTVGLDFDPGSRQTYSNFGYCLLGRVIEAKTGQTYEQYVRRSVLAPAGITQMRIGRTLGEHRAKDEVTYHTRNRHMMPRVFPPNVGRRVPEQYGGWHIEAMDAHGGWIASAIDLVRFARQFDSPRDCRILTPASIAATFARPPAPGGFDKGGKPKAAYYALGWLVRPVGKTGKANTWHAGALGGTSSLLVRRHDGLDWAVLFNMTSTADGRHLAEVIDPLVHKAVDAVKTWPGTDLTEAADSIEPASTTR